MYLYIINVATSSLYLMAESEQIPKRCIRWTWFYIRRLHRCDNMLSQRIVCISISLNYIVIELVASNNLCKKKKLIGSRTALHWSMSQTPNIGINMYAMRITDISLCIHNTSGICHTSSLSACDLSTCRVPCFAWSGWATRLRACCGHGHAHINGVADL